VTQWHPLFAKLLRPLMEGHYEVKTNVPVGDAPRIADTLLLRRTSATAPPFQGLWRWLTPWNVLEFKGPTVSARVADLDLLVELGLGIDRRLNEERAKQRQPLVAREEVSFWYLANHLGRRFLRDAQNLLGELEELASGVWRVRLLLRSVVLVSNRDLAVELDSVPMHLLSNEPLPNTQALTHLFGTHPELWDHYSTWIALSHPALLEEMRRMARAKKQPFTLDWNRALKTLGAEDFIQQLSPEVIMNEIMVDKLFAKLTPKQRKELLRRLQETPPTEQ
jgi:hypothetical protein